jgi:hypothetical protein
VALVTYILFRYGSGGLYFWFGAMFILADQPACFGQRIARYRPECFIEANNAD